jgi:hypothetical protein
MRAMGRFSKLRAPAVGWPVAPPPPPESRPPARPAERAAAPPAPPEPRPSPAPAPSRSLPSASPWLPSRRETPPVETATTTTVTAPADPVAGAEPASFRDRARIRRRLRYLRQTRELAFRDLGGFVFDSRRLERPREDIVEAKLKGLLAMDRELRALETALDERQELLLLHEPGISACPRCATIHGSDANFCPSCGLPCRGGPLPLGSLPPAGE